jgi:hypothetical protein
MNKSMIYEWVGTGGDEEIKIFKTKQMPHRGNIIIETAQTTNKSSIGATHQKTGTSYSSPRELRHNVITTFLLINQ